MILLSDVSYFISKIGKIVTPFLITTTLCEYFNKRFAHYMVIFVHSKRKIFVCNFLLTSTQVKMNQRIDFQKLIKFNGFPVNSKNSESVPLWLSLLLCADVSAGTSVQSWYGKFSDLKNKYWSAENVKKYTKKSVKPSLS